MEDAERDVAFENAKEATLKMIFGDKPTMEVDEVEKRVVDFKFGTGKSWMKTNRMTGNNDNTGVAEINRRMRENNGYLEMGIKF